MSIEELIEKSFNDLIKAITTDGTSSQLIFPCYRDGNERRSEQELRQIFLRNVEEDKTYFYSVETPTKLVYCISNSEQPIGKENHETGDHHRSGNYDVTLYSENKIEDKNDLSKVIVYLVCIHGKGKTASTYHFSLADLKKNYTVGTNYNDIKDKSWLNEKIFNTEE